MGNLVLGENIYPLGCKHPHNMGFLVEACIPKSITSMLRVHHIKIQTRIPKHNFQHRNMTKACNHHESWKERIQLNLDKKVGVRLVMKAQI